MNQDHGSVNTDDSKSLGESGFYVLGFYLAVARWPVELYTTRSPVQKGIPPERKRAIPGFQELHIASAACRISETISVSRTYLPWKNRSHHPSD
jgi:hypothetical protein